MLEKGFRFRWIQPLYAAIAFIVLVGMSLPVQAQMFRGSISGTVTDPSGAVIAGVQVTLTSQETNISHKAATGTLGLYRFSAVDPGLYTLEVKKSGFQAKTIKNILLSASQDLVINSGMTVSGLAATFDVHDLPGAQLPRNIASVQMVLPGQTLDEVPFFTTNLVPGGARNFAKYALLAPTVARTNGQNQFSSNGQRTRNNNFMIDGTDNNFNTITFPMVLMPPEAIGEFSVQAETFSAEFGKHTGAQINVITKHGTNQYHGEAWDFYRGNSLEPLSLSNRIAGLKKSPGLVDNQFGGDIGGPIFKNKTFFFGLFQANLQRQGATAQTPITIPTAAGYATLQTVALRSGQSADSRQAVLNALAFLPAVYPTIKRFDSTASTQTVNGIPIETGTFTPIIPQRFNLFFGTARIDHNLSANDRFSYRIHIDDQKKPLATGNFVAGEKWAADTQSKANNQAGSYIRTIGSNFVNEARLAYTRMEPDTVDRDPVTSSIKIGSLFAIGGLSSLPNSLWERTYQFQNVSTYVLKRHTLKFGFDLARTTLYANSASNSKGTWTFTTLENFMNNTSGTLAQLVSAPSAYKFNQLKQAYFFQDDFKLTRTLTINAGLRYETESVPMGFFGVTNSTIQTATAQGATTAQLEILRGLPGPGHRDTNNFGPRVGFAFNPDSGNGPLGKVFGGGKTSIRGGFGIMYDSLFYGVLGNPATNYPRTDSQSNASLTDQFPTLLAKTALPTLPSGTTTFVNIPSNAQSPTMNYWSLTVQRQLASHVTMEVGYSGNRSYHALRQDQANPGILSAAKAAAVIANPLCTNATFTSATCLDPAGFPASPAPSASTASRVNPNWGSRVLIATDGGGTYNAMYVAVTGKVARTSFGFNYTWSKTMSDSEEFSNDSGDPTGIFPSSPNVPQNYLNRHGEWSQSALNRPQRLTLHFTYEIPWFKNSPFVARQIFSGWQASGLAELQSGAPFTVVIGVDAVGTGTAVSARPNYNANGILTIDPVTLNLRTFTTPLDGTGVFVAPRVIDPVTGAVKFLANTLPTGGNLGRNTFRGPGYASANMSLVKKIALPFEKQLEIRADFINVFNHDNFQNPNSNMSNVNFGKQVLTPLTDARQVLLGAKFRF